MQAFKVFSLGKSEFGSKEIRGVMQVFFKSLFAREACDFFHILVKNPDMNGNMYRRSQKQR